MKYIDWLLSLLVKGVSKLKFRNRKQNYASRKVRAGGREDKARMAKNSAFTGQWYFRCYPR